MALARASSGDASSDRPMFRSMSAQFFEAFRQVGVVGADRPLVDRLCALKKGFSLRVLALVGVERCQAVEASGHVRVFRAEGIFPDHQGPLIKAFGLRMLVLLRNWISSR